MSALSLRILAIVLMLIDHIGYFTGESVFRIVGRLSFPIFAFLIANGFKFTRNVYRYAARLGVFAIISEFVFDVCINGGKVVFVTFSGVIPRLKLDNVFFTLLIGLCFLIINRFLNTHMKRPWLVSLPLLLFMSYFATFAGSDYGALGVLWVVLFGVFDVAEKKNRVPLAIGAVLLACWRVVIKSITAALNVSFAGVPVVNAFIQSGNIGFMDKIQCFAVLSLVFVFLYNSKSGMPKLPIARTALKYSFYAFYPLHIIILYFVFG
ncbi:MAG: hypothetical protein IKU61_00400 [Clostridia bacterium]|nr:hypothetical protein [Clostridia bacterium]